jgi:transcriptional regulator with XRE-family HTH domain
MIFLEVITVSTHEYEKYIRDRITQLRLQKGISEYKLSYDLGHSRGYIYNITSGKSLPPLTELFSICEYFDITPAEFFDDRISNPELIQKAVEGMKTLSDSDVLLILNHINRLQQK